MSFLYDLFIPHHGNDNRAGLLKPQILSLLTLIFVCYQFFFNFFALAGPKVLGYASNILPEKIVELTNQKRATAGLPPLKLNALLTEAAQRKAGDMFAFNYWAHNSPSGRDPWSFFKEAGYKYLYAGENLARDFRDPGSVVEAWMNSSSHRENVMNSKYQEIGIAVVDGSLQGVETTLVVQLFGAQSAAVAQKPVRKLAPKEVVAQKPAPAQQTLTKETLSQKTEGRFMPLVNPFSLAKIVSIFLAGVILGAFLVDLLVVSERRTPRLSSRSFAQLLFLGFIILIALFSQQGAIL